MTDAPFSSAPGDAPHGPHAGNPYRTGPTALGRFFDWIRSSGMVRGGERWFAGVCGAIAVRTGLDPLIVRGIAVVAAILGAPILFAYAVGWALLPDLRGRIHAEQALRGVFEPAMIAIGALLLVTLVPFSHGLWWEGAPLAWGMPGWLETTFAVGWGIAVTVGLIWLVVFLARRMPAAGTRQGPGSGAPRPGTAPDDTAPYEQAAYQQAAYAPTAPTGAAPADTDGSATADTDSSANADDSPTDTFATDAFPTAPYPTAAYPAPSDTPTAPYDLGPYQTGARDAERDAARAAEAREWREYRRQERAEAHAWHREWHRHRHPGAGFSAIVLGLALASGAVAAGVYSGVAAGGTWSMGALLIGLAATLGALAVGIIVSGLRGRDSGAMGGFAFLAVVALVALGLFPSGTNFYPFGAPQWTIDSASTVADYALIGGQATVDLTNLDSASSGSVVDVWVGFGETDLVLPADQPVRVESNLLAGAVDHDGDALLRGADPDRGGVFFHDAQTFNTDGAGARSIPVVRVWSLAGYVNIVND
ncbi:PspC domain-containing protein [Cryobacterium tepidiphilum]|uniref:PspC domain-containing protein n=1 Tax=Cryobacterium tepidiphilum TaxID=2486026 RepID=A0A3M8KTR5_9MICO|nr:PspC domain-containing protein [Cryobacterium tepidiphilum]RNE56643.1 PspC domain-containing protein [Cryobacterium tepidiphilum]